MREVLLQERRRPCEGKSRGRMMRFEDGKGSQTKDYRWTLDAEKGKAIDDSLRAPWRKELCGYSKYLDFNSLELTLDF
jgi:hypothetical protein